MNRAYRLVWNQALHLWIPVAECARGRGKTGRALAVPAALALSASLLHAAPQGGQIVSGAGQITQSGATTTITQSSQNLSVNWQGFNTTAQETVNFVQPSATAIAVNRIYDTNGTQFFGRLNANGQVYLINPNGILFGSSAQVNVGGLVASTLDLADAQLGGATRSFSGAGTGSVVNQGTLNGRYVALLGNTVRNEGTIAANGGAVALGAGSAVTLTFADNQLVQMQVDQNTLNNLAANGGLIQANGGMVLLSAGAKNALLASVVNNTGVIEARSVQNVHGTIVLDGGNLGTVSNSGTLDASGLQTGETGGTVKMLGHTVSLLNGGSVNVSGDAGGGTALIGGNFQGGGPEQHAQTTTIEAGSTINADAVTQGQGGLAVVWSDGHTTVNGAISARGGANGGDGGQVETSGHDLSIGHDARVNTLAPHGQAGNWLLDPVDFVISSQGAGGNMTDQDLSNALMFSDVTIQTGTGMTCSGFVTCGSGTPGNGDITVNGDAYVSWSATTTLTLSAYRHVNIDGTLDPANALLGSSGSASGSGSIVLRADNTGIGMGTVNIANGYYAGGTSGIATAGAGSTTIYYNPSSWGAPLPSGYYANGSDFLGVFRSYQLVHPNDASGVVSNKVYDGTTTATMATPFSTSLVGLPTGVSLVAGTATFSDKNAGTGKTVTFSGYTLGGANANQYFLSRQPYSQIANITAKAVTLTAPSVTKAYDGGTAYTATAGNLTSLTSALIAGDSVSGATLAFADKNAGNNKTLNLNGVTINDGNSGNNYSVTLAGNTTSTITAKAVTLTAPTGSKTYDGGTAYTTTAGDLSTLSAALVGGDTITAANLAYTDKNAGTNKTLNLNGVTINDGNSGNNYNLTLAGNTASTITQKALTVTAQGVTKTYDGTTTASGTPTLGTLALGDTVNLAATQAFLDKNAGSNKTVRASGLTLKDGSNADMTGNYAITYVDNTSSVINQAALTVTAQGVTKTYDGTTTASGAPTVGSLVAGDSVNTAATQAFLDKNAGSNKTVRASGLTLKDGSNADMTGNYAITYVDHTASTINQLAVTLTAPTVSKTYDGGTAYTPTAGDLSTLSAALVGSDTATAATLAYADKNAGTNKTLNLNSVTINDGNGGNNYSVTLAGNTASTITAKAVTLTAPTVSKTYDGGTTYTTTASDLSTLGAALVGGDTVTAATLAYTDKNAGAGKTVNLSTVTVNDGNSGNNYSVTLAGNTTSTIAQKALTLGGITANDKTYDGSTAATLNTAGVTFTGRVGADVVTLGGMGVGTFSDKNVGTGKTVTVSGYTLGGPDGANYAVGQPSGLTASITPATLSVSGVTAANKVYNGDTVATVNTAGQTFSGSFGSDVLSLSSTGAFADKNVGNGKAVTVTLTGADAGNYTLTQPGLTANITPKALTLSGLTAANKVYDGTTAATINTSGATWTGLVGTDVVTVAATGAFLSPNAGTGNTVNLSSTYGGADAGNYTITSQATTTANITPRNLTVTANAATKTYDLQPYSGGNGVSYAGFASGESASNLGGTLSYGGTSQGAVDVGTYTITPSGLTSSNYALSFVDGVLTIAVPAPQVTPQQVAQTQSIMTVIQGGALTFPVGAMPLVTQQPQGLSLRIDTPMVLRPPLTASTLEQPFPVGASGLSPQLSVEQGGIRLTLTNPGV